MLKKATIFFLVVFSLFGEAKRPGAVFLTIWPGSRPTALGGTFTAVADDASAAYYNPGGLSFLKGVSITGNHVPWLPGLWPDMYYDYLSITAPVGNKGVIAFHTIYLNTGKTDVVLPDGRVLPSYTTFDISPGIAYGYKVNEKLGVGGAVKLIYSFLVPKWVWEELREYLQTPVREGGTGITWAVDWGILYKPSKELSIGMNLQNMGPGISYVKGAEPDPLPLLLRIGFKFEPVHNQLFKLMFTSDFTKILVGMFADVDSLEIKPGEYKVNPSTWDKISYEISDVWRGFGIELGYYDMLFLRVGYFYDKTGWRGGIFINDGSNTYHISLIDFIRGDYTGRYEKIGLTYGAGIKLGTFQFDFGIDENIYDFPTTNRKFSLTYTF